MKKSYLLLVILILTITCNNPNWLLFRAGSDYFPLKAGNWWEYSNYGQIEQVAVVGETIAFNTPCIHLLRNYGDEFWLKTENEIRKLYVRTVNIGGTDYEIQNAWLLQYQLPLVLGAQWSEVFTDTVLVMGDTYRIYQTISRMVTEICDVNVFAGTFHQCYKLDYLEEVKINDSLVERYAGYEWFAPQVGLIKKVINNLETLLMDYSVQQ
ncbi:MAG: hypothetical protein N2748_02950 [candidate division WOR-3 bacterium]|nr:hypothetical protein [candidate division WOR-3 bacterium]